MAESSSLFSVVTLLGAAIVVVPLFKRLGLGSVLGYLAAGLLIGPFGLKLINDAHAIVHFAELGVVMFLFLVGLEMQPKHLWGMRHSIFGLGSLQILVAIIGLTLVSLAYGFSLQFSFIAAAGFVLTSTAIVMQTLSERGEMASEHGKRIVAVLLFEDLLIVPLLALVAFLSPESREQSLPLWQQIGMGVGAVAVLVAAGIWLLNPLFRLIAKTKIRELMTAVALFVVLGAALLMEKSGLSMAMGAFLSGVLLSNSAFRHQLEVDIEPFKGLLLGLFFLGVGMSLDLSYVWEHLLLIVSAVVLMMLVKGIAIYWVARLNGSNSETALDRAVMMAQGGEFAFVLFAAAANQGVISSEVNANMTAIVVLSMLLTPLVMIAHQKWLLPRFMPTQRPNDTIEETRNIILVGLGRYGQIVHHLLRSAGYAATVIEKDEKLIQGMQKLGVKSYYGNANHPDLLEKAGVAEADLLIIAINKPTQATEIARIARKLNPDLHIIARAYDRVHTIELTDVGVNVTVRETFDSAIRTGKAVLANLGIAPNKVDEIGTLFFEKDRHKLKMMADAHDPNQAAFDNQEMINIALRQDQDITLAIQQILIRED